MASVTLLHPEQAFTIPALQVMTKCSLFQKDPILLISPYRVQSPVSLSIFREFLSALNGNSINITDTNFTELQQLCNDFDFSELAAKLSDFRRSIDFRKPKGEAKDVNARGRIASLEEKANQHSHVIAMLQTEVRQLSTDFERLVGEVSALRFAAMSPTVTPSQNQPPLPSPPTSQSITSTPSQKQALTPSPAVRQPSQSITSTPS
jgi:hypothetical protein